MVEIEQKIKTWLGEILPSMDAFFVELIAKGKRLELYIDKVPSITIDELVQVSRHLEAQLDEEGSVPEDYTLNVSSPGMGNPLRVREQYVKRTGRQLKITTFSEERLEGRLVKVLEHGIEFLLEPLEGKSKPGKKKKNASDQSTSIEIDFKDIKKAILHFNF